MAAIPELNLAPHRSRKMTASRWPLPLMPTLLDDYSLGCPAVLELPLSGGSGAVGKA